LLPSVSVPFTNDWSIFIPSSTAPEADLCHALESDVTSISQLSPFDRSSMVLIQDGMALLQSMNVKAFKTFGDLGF
jgi:hypothetical protein